jgi:hypothetical protein
MPPGLDNLKHLVVPHTFWLRKSLEYSLYDPIGIWLAADRGKVAQLRDWRDAARRGPAGRDRVAGDGGGEDSRFAFTIGTSLLGGSARPSLQ